MTQKVWHQGQQYWWNGYHWVPVPRPRMSVWRALGIIVAVAWGLTIFAFYVLAGLGLL